jgi:carbamate kinase
METSSSSPTATVPRSVSSPCRVQRGPKGRSSRDVLSAETEGMLGYLIERELRNALHPGKEWFRSCRRWSLIPPIPPSLLPRNRSARCTRRTRRSACRWSGVGRSFRMGWPAQGRCSPRPLSILELPVIALLASRGIVAICAGGRGIPVARDDGAVCTASKP